MTLWCPEIPFYLRPASSHRNRHNSCVRSVRVFLECEQSVLFYGAAPFKSASKRRVLESSSISETLDSHLHFKSRRKHVKTIAIRTGIEPKCCARFIQRLRGVDRERNATDLAKHPALDFVSFRNSSKLHKFRNCFRCDASAT